MASAAAVIQVAKNEIGYVESGTNITKYGAWYGDNGQPWCAQFISWCGDQAAPGHSPYADAENPKGFEYTPTWADWFRQRNAFVSGSSSGIRAGDIVFYDFGLGRISHVGLVVSADANGYSTIEGNTYDTVTGRNGDTVATHTRTHHDGFFRGYGRPLYDDMGGGSAGGYDMIDPLTPSYEAPPKRALVPLKGIQPVQGNNILTAIRVSGARMPTDLTNRVTSAVLTFASTEKSTLELTVQDNATADYATAGIFSRDYQAEEFGRPVSLDFGDQHMQVANVKTTKGSGGPLHTVTAISASIGYLTSWAHKGTTTFGQVNPHKWVQEMAANAGARSIVEDTKSGDVVLARRAEQTTWDVMQQLAKALGAVCHEHDNTIFFGRPSWLAVNAAKRIWKFSWTSWDTYSPGLDGMPVVDVAMDDSNGDKLTFGLISDDRWTIRPGDYVTMSGRLRSLNGDWLVDKVQMVLSKSKVVQVTCGRIVDPQPQPPTGTLGDLPAINTTTGGATLGIG